jgi:RHS repeat-associated protein
MQLPGRTYSSSTGNYRYGFNGQEKDNEIKGEGNTYTAQFWEYDARSVRRWNLDPKPTVGISPYSAFSGNPIRYSDPLGDTLQPLTTDVLRTMARKSGFTGTGIVFNRRVGKAFESIGLAEQGLYENTTRYTSQERAQATAGTTTTVIPDGMRDVKEVRTQLIPPGLKTTVYPNSSVFEVKAVSGFINLSTSNYQIQGELDVVKNSAGGRAGRGTMTFVTTANTFIGADVLGYAQRNKIQLYQVFSFRETDDNSIHFTPPIPLNNASQYTNSINITPLARIVDIRFGYSLNPTWTRPENPANPDVEEVQ